jgi:hypothetical protein
MRIEAPSPSLGLPDIVWWRRGDQVGFRSTVKSGSARVVARVEVLLAAILSVLYSLSACIEVLK